MKTFYVFFWKNGKIVKMFAEAETKEDAIKQYEKIAQSEVLAVEISSLLGYAKVDKT